MFNFVAPRVAGLPLSGAFGAMFFPGIKSFVQGDIPFLDGEVPAANGVVTARAALRGCTPPSPTADRSTTPSSCRTSWRRA
jgi:hypothetical protein